MSLTYEQKEQYVNAIDAIWQGSMQNNNVNAISDEVKSLVDIVLTEIRNGTKPFLATDITFNIFYIPGIPWQITLVTAVATGGVTDWIAAIRGNKVYASVVNSAALNFKSSVQLALYGL